MSNNLHQSLTSAWHFRVGALLLVPLMLLGVGCTGGRPDSGTSTSQPGEAVEYSGEYPYRIVTTCGMVTDIVRQVAGEKSDVVGLMGPTVDPHLYKPTRNDVKQLMEADLVFYSGLMLEGKMAESFEQVERRGKPVFAVTDGIDRERLLSPPEYEGHYDPHVWMDVSMWSEAVSEVARRLGKFDPKHASHYQSNAEKYHARLAELHAYVEKVIDTIPDGQRVLVTSHDAFGYFSRAYSIPVRAPQGITTESEAGVEDINQLVGEIVDKKIKAIFVESSVSPKNIQAIIEGAEQQGWNVGIGGELFSDAMGQPGTYEGTYLGMMDHNATTIARALGGEAPAGGFAGKLSESEE